MSITTDKIKLGIVGACGRGGSFRKSCQALGTLHIHAVCDINSEKIGETKELLGAQESYSDFEQMLDKAKLDAVIIGTPMPLHVPQAIAALKRNIHVLSEVPAGVSIEECRELVQACKESSAVYMMAENYNYTRPSQIIKEIARQGLFGTPYYAEGEYIHELKGLNEITRWRRKWQTGINGITYGTHSLGPILQWMPGERVTSVCCAGSGHHYKDASGVAYEAEDTSVMLGKLSGGGLVKIRVDMLSDRPHAANNHQLQGTDGCYESGRGGGQPNRIWLRKFSDKFEWRDLSEIAEEFLPDAWRQYEEAAKSAGHGGGDLIELVDFSDAILGKRETPLGIHEAMDMTLPGLVSQQSIAQGGVWLDVPDSRTW